jgi:integrase
VRTINRLRNLQVQTARPGSGRSTEFFSDGGNLYLQTSLGTAGNVRRSWIFLYERNGKRHSVGLGSIDTISLKRARERARDLREQLLDFVDPLTEKRKAKQAQIDAQLKAVTFAKATDLYLAKHSGDWRSDVHRKLWVSSMKRLALPRIGNMSVADVDTAAVLRVLEPIWKDTRETASRVRARIESVLDFAAASSLRHGDNPARWKGHLENLLPAKTAPVEHFAAIHYDELPAFMAELRQHPDTLVAGALEFCILTAARTSRVVEAIWDEINWDERAWVVEAAKMKRNREHVTPLCDRATQILSSTKMLNGTGRIFPIGLDAMRRLLVELRPGFTVHGLRSSFYDFASERTGSEDKVIKLAMSHAVGDETERAYRRGQMFEKRRRLMQLWQDFLDKPTASAGVTPIRKGDANA